MIEREIIRLRPEVRPILTVVIHTEEEFDWSAEVDRKNVGVEHMRSIGLLQTVLDDQPGVLSFDGRENSRHGGSAAEPHQHPDQIG